jgi:anaerobic magnesium-protoporphyrin IX monomethyl ester cyclase
MKVVLALAPVWDSVTPPLSLAFLKSSLSQAGFDSRCIDFSNEFRPIMVSALGDISAEEYITSHPELYQKWAKRICAERPDVVAFSLLGSNFKNSSLIAKEVRNLLPEVLIVVGGPSLVRENMGLIREAFSYCNYIVEGEGESIFVDLIKCHESGGDVSQLKQLWLKRPDSSVYYTGAGPLQNIDKIPLPDFSDFYTSDYQCPDRLPMLFSRGCILNCNYCENKWNHLTQRSREGRLVFEELKRNVKQYHIKEYMFNDDSLISYKTFKQLEEYCDLTIAEGLTLPWSVYGTRVERLLTEPYVKKLKISGLERLSLGVESFSTKIQHEMGKSSLYDDADKTCRLFSNEGIKTESWIIYGYPTETDADFYDTLNWFIKNPNVLSHVTANSFGPNAKYQHDKPGIAHYKSGRIWDWAGPESTIEKRKERFLALIEVLESIRVARKGKFTFYFGDPMYVKYFSSWTKADREYLFQSWARLEVPIAQPAKHIVTSPSKTKQEVFLNTAKEMHQFLLEKIKNHLDISHDLNAEEKAKKFEFYKDMLQKIYSLSKSKISPEAFYSNALNGDLHIMIADLDTRTPEEISTRIPDMGYQLEHA